jgi:cysteine synthase
MELTPGQQRDATLLSRFESEVWSKAPHLEGEVDPPKVVNPTPLVDLTAAVKECAREVYGLDLGRKELVVFGKLESRTLGGSIKARPALEIIHEAIATGKLRSGQTIFEATSGNFGIALGQFVKLGLGVVVLVSRKLQEGVFDELGNEGVKAIDLDMDICPAPGLQIDSNVLAAKAIALNMRSDLARLGFDPAVFDGSRGEVETLLARQDVINLAKLLARIYGGFCPQQYDNDLNVLAHERVTAVEIDQQLGELGQSLDETGIVCTFGTGGTSLGLSGYVMSKYGKKSVHVVFPSAGQEVAGIRSKEKAAGLRFYRPGSYAGEYEVDFAQAKRLLKFFVDLGYDIGESSSLALYAVIQMTNFGKGGKYVVLLADGAEKYRKNLKGMEVPRDEVTLKEAVSDIGSYKAVLWTHTMFVPSEAGVQLIARSLGCDREKVKVAGTDDVNRLVNGQVTDALGAMLPDDGKVLLVCMAGGTSLRAAKALTLKGVRAQSLTGGISTLSQAEGEPISELVRPGR